MTKCLPCGITLANGPVANFNAPSSSLYTFVISKVLQISSNNCFTSNNSWIHVDNTMYSACIAEVAILVCNFELQVTGTTPNQITYPVLLLIDCDYL